MDNFPRSRVKDVLLGGAIFTGLGPPVGLLAWYTSFALWETINPEPLIGPMTLRPSLIHLLGAYLLGGIPCLLAGLVAGFFRPRIRSLWSYLIVGLLGFTFAFAPLAILGKEGSLVTTFLFFGLPGLAAGIVCAWVIGFFRRQRQFYDGGPVAQGGPGGPAHPK